MPTSRRGCLPPSRSNAEVLLTIKGRIDILGHVEAVCDIRASRRVVQRAASRLGRRPATESVVRGHGDPRHPARDAQRRRRHAVSASWRVLGQQAIRQALPAFRARVRDAAPTSDQSAPCREKHPYHRLGARGGAEGLLRVGEVLRTTGRPAREGSAQTACPAAR